MDSLHWSPRSKSSKIRLAKQPCLNETAFQFIHFHPRTYTKALLPHDYVFISDSLLTRRIVNRFSLQHSRLISGLPSSVSYQDMFIISKAVFYSHDDAQADLRWPRIFTNTDELRF